MLNTIRRCVITTAYALAWLGLALLVLRELDAMTPSPDPDWRVSCPNYDSIRVHPTPWQAAHGRKTYTIPATCGDTTAVTWGHLK